MPVTAENMNYAAVITVGVIVLAGCVPFAAEIFRVLLFTALYFSLWYMVAAHRHYEGPISNLPGGEKSESKTNSQDELANDVKDSV